FQLIKTFVNIVFFHKLDLFCFYVLTNVFMSWNVMKWDIKSLHHLSGIFVVANNKRNFHLEFIVCHSHNSSIKQWVSFETKIATRFFLCLKVNSYSIEKLSASGWNASSSIACLSKSCSR